MTDHDALCPVAGTDVPGCHPCTLIRAVRAEQDDRWHRFILAAHAGPGMDLVRGWAMHARPLTEASVQWAERGAGVVAAQAVSPLIYPDCRSGKHASCVGGVCGCDCHGQGEAA